MGLCRGTEEQEDNHTGDDPWTATYVVVGLSTAFLGKENGLVTRWNKRNGTENGCA